jgi:hypothetical protein
MIESAAIKLESNFRHRSQVAKNLGDRLSARIWDEAADAVAKASSNPAAPLGERLRREQWYRPGFAERQRARARARALNL